MNNQNGKVITISSVKGGVGKTTLTINLAGLYFLMKKRVLIIDLDLYAGGIATCMNVDNKKDIYLLIFGHTGSSLRHVGSSSPDQGLNLDLLHWESTVCRL